MDENPAPTEADKSLPENSAGKVLSENSAGKGLSESSSSSESEESSSDGEPPRKRRRRNRSTCDMDRRFELLSHQLVSHVNSILLANLPTTPKSSQPTDISATKVKTVANLLEDPFSRPQQNISDLSVSVKEPAVLKAKHERVVKISALQRFDSTEWNSVRYTEVQKKHVAFPAFSELKVNEELRRFEDPLTPLRWHQMERSFAALSNAFLAQNEAVNKALHSLIDWSSCSDTQLSPTSVYDKLKDLFGNESDYKTISHDILQIICGKRAEVLELRRRQLLKAVKNKYQREDLEKIPPSSEYMFSAQVLSEYLQKIGGVDKLEKQVRPKSPARAKSPVRSKSPVASTSRDKSFRSQPNKQREQKGRKHKFEDYDRKKKGGRKGKGHYRNK